MIHILYYYGDHNTETFEYDMMRPENKQHYEMKATDLKAKLLKKRRLGKMSLVF